MVASVDNKHRNNTERFASVAGGIGGFATVKLVNKPSNKIIKAYIKHFCTNQPVMFKDEAKYFYKLNDFAKEISSKNPSNTELASICEKLSNTGSKSEDFIKAANEILNSRNVQEAKSYSNGFVNLGKYIHNSETTDDEVKTFCQQLLEKKSLNKYELGIVEEIAKNPECRKNLYPVSKFNFLKVYRNFYLFTQDVIISPELISLVKQMYTESGLAEKGVSYRLGTEGFFKEREQVLINDFKKFEDKDLKKCAIKEGDNGIKRFFKDVINKAVRKKYKKQLNASLKMNRAMFEGKNACYSGMYKCAMVPVISNEREAIFHELGHAMNFTISSQRTKAIHFFKEKFPKIALPLMFYSSIFLKRGDNKKVENAQPESSQNPNPEVQNKSGFRKVREFIKNNIMSLALIIGAPKLAEEGYASYRAVKFLKGKVNPKQLKSIKIKNLSSWGSYATAAILAAGSLKLGVLASDQIQKLLRKENK